MTHYFQSVEEALEHCGKLLYGNPLFELLILCLGHTYHPGRQSQEYEVPQDNHGQACRWVLRSQRGMHSMEPRSFEHTHDLFGMILAELQQGATFIKVCGQLD